METPRFLEINRCYCSEPCHDPDGAMLRLGFFFGILVAGVFVFCCSWYEEEHNCERTKENDNVPETTTKDQHRVIDLPVARQLKEEEAVVMASLA